MKKLVGQGKPFHSAVDKAAGMLKRKVGTGAEFMKELMGITGIKPTEIQERGLTEIMGMPRMTHDQFMAALASKPAPAIQEKVLGGDRSEPDSEAPYHEQYTLPGGDNYREMLIKLPKFNHESKLMEVEARLRRAAPADIPRLERIRNDLMAEKARTPEVFQGVYHHFGGEPGILASMRLKDRFVPDLEGPHNVKIVGGGGTSNKKFNTREEAEAFADVKNQGGYKTEITPLNNKKLLHLEELQSDWHQEARKKRDDKVKEIMTQQGISKAEAQRLIPENYGYAQPETSRMIGKVVDAGDGTYKVEWPDGTFSGGYNWASAMEKAEQGKSNAQPGVPDAPFKKNWEEMALKRLIHHAAEKGYHGIVVTPGEEQADRYSLAKHISGVDYIRNELKPHRNEMIAYDPKGNVIFNEFGMTPEKLEQHIGKEAAQKLLSQEPQPNQYGLPTHSLRGEQLVVGGEGMKAFYDKKVPNILNSIGKKYGVKTHLHGHGLSRAPKNSMDVAHYPRGQEYINGQINWPEMVQANPELANKFQTPLHHFPITEEMRKDVLANGLPLYASGGEVDAEEVFMGKGGKVKELEQYLRDREGEYGLKRLQRAADEIPGLENMYTLQALKEAFGGDNAKALMTMNPADFEKFAVRLFPDPDTREEEMEERIERGHGLPPMSHHEYIKHLAKIKGGFADVPFLEVNKRPEYLPNISGHEGRHRSRAMMVKGAQKSLVRLLPSPSMRESMPRRNRENFIEAMKKELGEKRLVTGEGRSLLPADLEAPEHKNIERRNMLGGRPQLPEIYKDGGDVDVESYFFPNKE